MTENPLFSVLIANYNNGCFLQEAIDSVLAQSYSNWEIVIVDDGSTDQSQLIYDKYTADNRFRIFFNGENKGCGFTKRRCAELSKGEICAFLDPDDTLLPEALQKHVKAHIDSPLASIIYSRCFFLDCNGSVVGKSRLLELKEGENYFNYRWYGAMHLASFKNKYYKKTEGISPLIKAGVDQDLYFKVEEVGEVCVLNEFTYNYYNRNENAITKELGNLLYWNMEVRKAACKRRGLDENALISEDWKYAIRGIVNEALYKQEIEIRSSKAYRLGKFLLKPFSLFKSN